MCTIKHTCFPTITLSASPYYFNHCWVTSMVSDISKIDSDTNSESILELSDNEIVTTIIIQAGGHILSN